MNSKYYFILLALFFFACKSDQKPKSEDTADLEAFEDSLALVAAYDAQDKIPAIVYPDIETQAIHAESEEDAADDPAIWVHPQDPSKSLIYGSNKKGGLAVYNLQGTEVAYYPIGNVNNVDVLYNFPLGDSLITIVGCSNRSNQSVDLFKVNQTDGRLANVASDTLTVDPEKIDDIYGFCFAHDQNSGVFYAVINGKNGMMQQFEMIAGTKGIELVLRRSVQFDSQTEGMVADNDFGHLYVGEESRGIWKLSISPEGGSEKKKIGGSDENNPNISYDVEGLSMYKEGENGYLIASSQGNFSYAVFDRKGDNRYLTSFKIKDGSSVDGVEETDGLDIVSDSLSSAFPNGLIVLQDGFNYDGEDLQAQNFKYVGWDKVLALLSTD